MANWLQLTPMRVRTITTIITTGREASSFPFESAWSSWNTPSHRAHRRNAMTSTAPTANGSTAARRVLEVESNKCS